MPTVWRGREILSIQSIHMDFSDLEARRWRCVLLTNLDGTRENFEVDDFLGEPDRPCHHFDFDWNRKNGLEVLFDVMEKLSGCS